MPNSATCTHEKVSRRTKSTQVRETVTSDEGEVIGTGYRLMTQVWWECDLGCGTVFAPTGEIKMHVDPLVVKGVTGL